MISDAIMTRIWWKNHHDVLNFIRVIAPLRILLYENSYHHSYHHHCCKLSLAQPKTLDADTIKPRALANPDFFVTTWLKIMVRWRVTYKGGTVVGGIKEEKDRQAKELSSLRILRTLWRIVRGAFDQMNQ